ncbi:MAG: bifunctional metallophosphatase/5'-nucleotidase, partial [Gammaproteobacteria bacterium]|nr:bifunctional metallophosphatase/5'-nucleotidase [Gammaproteobacteria bacterium]
IQGNFVSSISKGKYNIELMNEAEYDLFVLGNHEFDYGLDELRNRINEFSGTTLSANIEYVGSNENKLSSVKPYEIVEYGQTKVAYIGLTTPSSITSSTPGNFIENNSYAYSFFFGGEENEEYFYNRVQYYIDEVKEYGADYVIILSHLGDTKSESPYDSRTLISKTNGVDAVLDGHAHNIINNERIKNKDGDKVLLSSTGSKFERIGELVISNNKITSTLIKKYDGKDTKVDSKVSSILSEYNEKLSEVIGHTNYDLNIGNSIQRLVRMRETNLADLVTDSYRIGLNAQIAIQNGGGIRVKIPAGDITYKNIYDVLPFGNMMCLIKAKGQDIINALEVGAMKVPSNTLLNAKSEFGGFLQVSGLKYTIDTSIDSSVKLNSKGIVTSIDGEYRVKDVKVLINNEYEDIEANEEYLVATTRYIAFDIGDGNNSLINSKEIISQAGLDYEYLVSFIQNNNLDSYKETDDRITIK